MRIGICGVSSTGKSTLATDLAAALGLPVLLDKDLHEKTFRRMEADGAAPHSRVFPEMSKDEHVRFERYIMRQRIALEERHDSFIADETPLDFLNYLYNICAPHPELMTPAEFQSLRNEWLDLLPRYDRIIYLPFGQLPIVDDARRFTNENLLWLWDFSLNGIITSSCFPRLRRMPYSDRAARLDFCKNFIRDLNL